jgi:hypothetical protein
MNAKMRASAAGWAILLLLCFLSGCGEAVNVAIYKHSECGAACCSCKQCCAVAEATANEQCRYFQPEDRGIPLYTTWQDLSSNDRYTCYANPFWDHERQEADAVERMSRRMDARESARAAAKWASMQRCIQSIQGSECRLVRRDRNPSGFYLTAEEMAEGWRQFAVIPEEHQ